MADIVQFEFGQPVEVALKFQDPKVFDGQYGERCMYSLTDGRVMYVDPLTAARIKSLGVEPGECFFVLKAKKGRSTEWAVFRELADAPAAPTYQRSRLNPSERAKRLPELVAARNQAANLEQQLEKSLEAVAERKQPAPATEVAKNSSQPRERWTEVLLQQTNAVIDVYAAALAHASAMHGNAVKAETIQSLLVTVFINLSRKQEGSRAA